MDNNEQKKQEMIPLKGKLSLWEYDGTIEYLKMPESDEEDEKMYKEIYEPLFV